MPLFVYISGPLTSSGYIPENVRQAVTAAHYVEWLGGVAYLPHLSVLEDFVDPYTPEQYMTRDLAWISKCDVLLRLPGESVGADREVEEAHRLGVPVVHGRWEFKLWWTRREGHIDERV